MGKNNKHQKKLKSERSRVKLRVKSEKTKFLPKGLNVTDTTFKIKPICLPEQLQSKSNEEPLSKRKLNTKELIQRLNHHNINMKVESAEELCLIINAYPEEILNKYLSQLLQGSCNLILDKETKVRKLCIKLLETIMKNVTVVKVEPLFGIISSFLRCSMTNIDTNIQEDSLMMLDVLLQHVPSLIAKDSEKILSNFLTLISILRVDSKPGRTLTVNLGSKLTTVKWKIKVLHRLRRILQSIIDVETITSKSDVLAITYKMANSKCTFPIYKTLKYSNWNTTKAEDINNEVILKQIKTLISLLYESWLEVAPENQKNIEKSECTNLPTDAAAILNCILNIIHLLHKYTSVERNTEYNLKSEFTSREYQKFIKSLLRDFPYAQPMLQQQSKSNVSKILDVQVDSKCLQENLLICNLTLRMDKIQSDDLQKIVQYINKCIKNRNYVPTDKMHLLTNVLNMLLVEPSNKRKEIHVNREELMGNVIAFYNNNYLSNNSRNEILCVLADVIHNPLIKKLPMYHVWLSTLPCLLCDVEIHEDVIDKLSLISKTGSKPFHNALLKRTEEILDNVPKIKIIPHNEHDSMREELIRTKILNMFTYSVNVYKEHLAIMQNFIAKNKNTTYGNYMEFNFSQYC